MKIKIIFLLAVLLTCGQSAAPNKWCDGMKHMSKSAQQAAPAADVLMMINETELLPIHHYFSNF